MREIGIIPTRMVDQVNSTNGMVEHKDVMLADKMVHGKKKVWFGPVESKNENLVSKRAYANAWN